MGRSSASFALRARRAFASRHNAQEERKDEEAGEGKGGEDHDRKWGSQGIRLEAGTNAYQVLGVSPSCSPEHLREAFTKLAKLTHPDLQPGPSTSAQFILVLSAYQILSTPAGRAQYDAYLRELSQSGKMTHNMERDIVVDYVKTDGDVVEWLRWYRRMVMNMVHGREIGTGGRFYDDLRENLQEAMHRAFFGPDIENDDFALPDCFEAEERAEVEELEVLHLVSGQKFIGAVLQVGPKALLEESNPKLEASVHSQLLHSSSPSLRKALHTSCTDKSESIRRRTDLQARTTADHDQSAFVDLEFYLYGNLVARATRSESKTASSARVSDAKVLDEITVYLCHDECSNHGPSKVQEVMLGTIVGLNMTESGEKGKVYSCCGEQTHIIWQFRTPGVNHMHWFKIDGRRMLCECKSTRARLPSSKYWLFEPRCEKHDIGGWYIETLFRRWQRGSKHAGASPDWAGKHLGLLHPAMYIFGIAYKTLDTELIRRRERSLWGGHQTLFVTAALRVLQCPAIDVLPDGQQITCKLLSRFDIKIRYRGSTESGEKLVMDNVVYWEARQVLAALLLRVG
ncbi:hypothetical protein GOP47_0012331 [Adiantum capillus-veneris]|uniref:J domain-containing protein n=1 Tax=Adiantum capillus-veneris TaxID=13818 RepID=A0A9D4UQG9_ADICA|nr:hypothetical protein GOP47_0012331 [Adiantum capillus-veneris]